MPGEEYEANASECRRWPRKRKIRS